MNVIVHYAIGIDLDLVQIGALLELIQVEFTVLRDIRQLCGFLAVRRT